MCMYVCICKYRQYTMFCTVYALYMCLNLKVLKPCSSCSSGCNIYIFMFQENPIILICHCYGVLAGPSIYIPWIYHPGFHWKIKVALLCEIWEIHVAQIWESPSNKPNSIFPS